MSDAPVSVREIHENRAHIRAYDRWLFSEFRPFVGRRVLEVGCGMGNFVEFLRDRELVVGIDIEPACIAAVRARFRAMPGVVFHDLGVLDPGVAALGAHRFDTAISSNVLEHIPDDAQALRRVWELLQPGGRLILVVPAHPCLFGSMDTSLGHCRRYTARQLRERVAAAGFRVLRLKRLNALGAVGWLVNARLLRCRMPPLPQMRMMNRLVPLVRAVERALPPPFGLSLLLVAVRD